MLEVNGSAYFTLLADLSGHRVTAFDGWMDAQAMGGKRERNRNGGLRVGASRSRSAGTTGQSRDKTFFSCFPVSVFENIKV
jgi:hypothetical protein